MKDFFGFRKMVSSTLIKFIYIVGMIFLTIAGIYMLFGNVLLGLGIIIIGNLLWRVVCEGWIVLFSIHDILGSVERSLKEK